MILLGFAVGAGIALIALSVHSSETNTVTSTFGDNVNMDSYLIQSPSSREPYLINISLNGTREELEGVTVEVNGTSKKPVKSTKSLELVEIPPLSGPNATFNYNYYGGDEFIYLSLGSYLTYTFSCTGPITSSCPAKLYVFQDYNNYEKFRNGFPFKATATSPCLLVGSTESWTIDGTLSRYYIGVEITDNILLKSNVSGMMSYYNTTGLSSVNLCHLSATNRNCNIDRCSRSFCLKPKSNMKYIFVKPSSSTTLIQEFKTPEFYGYAQVFGFFGGILLLIFSIAIIIGTCIAYFVAKNKNKKIRHHKIRNYESIKELVFVYSDSF